MRFWAKAKAPDLEPEQPKAAMVTEVQEVELEDLEVDFDFGHHGHYKRTFRSSAMPETHYGFTWCVSYARVFRASDGLEGLMDKWRKQGTCLLDDKLIPFHYFTGATVTRIKRTERVELVRSGKD